MKNNFILIINCFFYIFSLTEYLIGIKYINNEYNYKNFWFINLLNIILIPCYFILIIVYINILVSIKPLILP